ncbi:MAG: transposase [Acidobacteriota bacterium]|nr:transposase [Acidobacteriota bacterium]
MFYLITFACYGCHLHGDESGAVDRNHNSFGGPLVEANKLRLSVEQFLMNRPPYGMDSSRRKAVLDALRDRCSQNNWSLLAAHVRSNHVHMVVEADVRPERVMNDLKSYGSRCLNQSAEDEAGRKRWARHGSTRWLWKPTHVSTAIRYVIDQQGEPMAIFEATEPEY